MCLKRRRVRGPLTPVCMCMCVLSPVRAAAVRTAAADPRKKPMDAIDAMANGKAGKPKTDKKAWPLGLRDSLLERAKEACEGSARGRGVDGDVLWAPKTPSVGSRLWSVRQRRASKPTVSSIGRPCRSWGEWLVSKGGACGRMDAALRTLRHWSYWVRPTSSSGSSRPWHGVGREAQPLGAAWSGYP